MSGQGCRVSVLMIRLFWITCRVRWTRPHRRRGPPVVPAVPCSGVNRRCQIRNSEDTSNRQQIRLGHRFRLSRRFVSSLYGRVLINGLKAVPRTNWCRMIAREGQCPRIEDAARPALPPLSRPQGSSHCLAHAVIGSPVRQPLD